jgi:hypothetical protein
MPEKKSEGGGTGAATERASGERRRAKLGAVGNKMLGWMYICGSPFGTPAAGHSVLTGH